MHSPKSADRLARPRVAGELEIVATVDVTFAIR
jgi:hypothetical protein